MPASLQDQLVVAISSRALFDFEEENHLFETGDAAAYMRLQLDRLDAPARPSVAFALVKKLLAFNTPERKRVEVVMLSRNDPVSGMRAFRSAAANGVALERGVFTQGRAPFGYLRPLGAHLFLSANEADVKQALALAIDRDAIQKAVMRGLSSPTGMLAAPFVNGYTKALAAYPKADPARARKLLAEAGYPEGFTLTLDAPNDRYVNDEAIATAVAGFLARIGVKVTVQARPFALHNALLTKGDSDFYLYGWGVPTHDSAYVFDYLVHTRGKNRLGTWNITGYSNPQLDAQIESLSSEGNRDKRNATIQSIWEATRQAGFYIPLHDQMISNASIPSLDVPIHPNNITYFKLVKVKKP